MSTLVQIIEDNNKAHKVFAENQKKQRQAEIDKEKERACKMLEEWVARLPSDEAVSDFMKLLQIPELEVKGDQVIITWYGQSEALNISPFGIKINSGPNRTPSMEVSIAMGSGWQNAMGVLELLRQAYNIYPAYIERLRKESVQKMVDEIGAATIYDGERVHTIYESLLQLDSQVAYETITRYNTRVEKANADHQASLIEYEKKAALDVLKAAEVERYTNAYREWFVQHNSIVTANQAQVEAYKKSISPALVIDILVSVTDGYGSSSTERHTTLGKSNTGAWLVVNGCNIEPWTYNNVAGQTEAYLVEPCDLPPFYSLWMRLEDMGVATHIYVLAGTKREQVEMDMMALCVKTPEPPKYDSNLISSHVAYGIRITVENEFAPVRENDADIPF